MANQKVLTRIPSGRPVTSFLLGDSPRHLQEDEAALYYVRSYVTMRTTVGVLGLVMPLALIVGEWAAGAWHLTVRGSISSYYHGPMQDLFVAGLCIIAFLLMTYMGGHPQTRDFWFSLAAGLFLLGVVFFPTWLHDAAPYCGDTRTVPAGCSPIEQALHEGTAAHVHRICAILFIVSLALMSFLFARDEEAIQKNSKMRNWQIVFGISILFWGLWAFAGHTFGPINKLWLGEVCAVWSFALSWLFKGAKIGEILEAPKLHAPRSPRRSDVTPAVPPASEGPASATPVAGRAWG